MHDSQLHDLIQEVVRRRYSRREALRRALALGLSIPAISMVLAACGGGDDATSAATEGSSDSGSSASTAEASGSPAGDSSSSTPAADIGQSEADLYEAAKKEGKVVWYGAALQPTAASLIEAFGKKYPGVDIDYLRLGGSELITRYTTEVQAGQDSADLMLSSTTSPLIDLDSDGLVLEYTSPETDAYSSSKFPLAKPGKWLPWQILVWGPSYRTDLVKTEIKTWEDAIQVAKDEKLPIATSNVPNMDPGKHILYVFYENYGADKTKQMFQDLAALNPVLFTGHADAQAQQNSGEVPIIFHMVSKTAFDAISKGVSATWVAPDEGVPVDGYVLAVMQKAKHPNAAKLFMDYLLSEDGQNELIKVEYAYSARAGINRDDIPVKYSDLNILPWDPQKEVEMLPDLIKEWQSWFS